MKEGKWIPVCERLPNKGGRFHCRIVNRGKTFESERLLKIAGSEIYWLGGCRPFTRNDTITHWLDEDQ
jgi:hypothetical protein